MADEEQKSKILKEVLAKQAQMLEVFELRVGRPLTEFEKLVFESGVIHGVKMSIERYIKWQNESRQ